MRTDRPGRHGRWARRRPGTRCRVPSWPMAILFSGFTRPARSAVEASKTRAVLALATAICVGDRAASRSMRAAAQIDARDVHHQDGHASAVLGARRRGRHPRRGGQGRGTSRSAAWVVLRQLGRPATNASIAVGTVKDAELERVAAALAGLHHQRVALRDELLGRAERRRRGLHADGIQALAHHPPGHVDRQRASVVAERTRPGRRPRAGGRG